MKRGIFILLCGLTAFGAREADTVRVAAIQCPSAMGQTEDNLRNIIHLVRKASAQGAKIVVLPECAVQGYLDPIPWTSWAKKPDGDNPAKAASDCKNPRKSVMTEDPDLV